MRTFITHAVASLFLLTALALPGAQLHAATDTTAGERSAITLVDDSFELEPTLVVDEPVTDEPAVPSGIDWDSKRGGAIIILLSGLGGFALGATLTCLVCFISYY